VASAASDSRTSSSAASSTARTPRHGLALFAGLLLVSTSGPFIKMAAFHAYATVFWRTALAAPLFLLVAWRVEREHRPRLLLGALLFAAHFLLWVKAFDLTDFSSNLLLLVSQPVIAAALGTRLGEPPTVRTWIAVALALVGLLIIAGGDFRLGARALAGDAMCIVAGLAITLFYVVTRDARAATPLAAFMGWNMVAIAVIALPVTLLVQAPLVGASAAQWGWMLALVLLTTVAGHGLMNLAARSVTLFALNLVIVLEPAIAIAMGAVLFGARVTALQLGGGVLLAAAVIVGLKKTKAAAPTP
jgi:drug/metabolite transporter (DMT)-like permease